MIFALSSTPDLPSLPGGMSDKSAHALAYAGLGFLLVRALAGGLGRPVSPGAALLAVALGVAYGLSDEFHQLFVPGRQFDVGDLAADGLGVAAGAVVGWLCGIIWRFRDVLR
jgi:VanZ family protein